MSNGLNFFATKSAPNPSQFRSLLRTNQSEFQRAAEKITIQKIEREIKWKKKALSGEKL